MGHRLDPLPLNLGLAAALGLHAAECALLTGAMPAPALLGALVLAAAVPWGPWQLRMLCGRLGVALALCLPVKLALHAAVQPVPQYLAGSATAALLALLGLIGLSALLPPAQGRVPPSEGAAA
ncbi:MAG: hypothetical protein U1E77_19705 [Inhella sp.]